MGYQPLEQLLPRSGGSIYKLILVASKRATELADGQPPLIDFPSSPKATTIALEEIVQGKVELAGLPGRAGKIIAEKEKKKGAQPADKAEQ